MNCGEEKGRGGDSGSGRAPPAAAEEIFLEFRFAKLSRPKGRQEAEPKTLKVFGFRSLGQSPKLLQEFLEFRFAKLPRRKPKAFARARDRRGLDPPQAGPER
jgi:hypothetical protein